MGEVVSACLAAHPDGTVLRLRLQPRARRSGVVGMVGDRLKIAVCAPPVDGKANAELCRFLATLLDIPKSAVVMVQGETAREKAVLLRGMAPAAVAVRLGL